MNNRNYQKIIKINSDIYENVANSFSDTRKYIWENTLNDIFKHIKPDSKVLDIGCGNARLYQKLAPFKIDYLGVDQSKNLIKIATEKYPKTNFICANIYNLKLKSKFYYIFILAVLHHIPKEIDRINILKNLKSALNENGQIIISVWNRWQTKYQKYFNHKESYLNDKIINKYKLDDYFFSDLDKKDLLIPWKDTSFVRYVYAYNLTNLKNDLQKAGFKINFIYYADKNNITNREKGLNIYAIAKK
jgi:SAM-dependent methyltransferase